MPGSFTHEVALKVFPADRHQGFAEMAEGFSALRAGRLSKIVVPFENSIGGAVPDTLDQLILLEGWSRDFAIREQVAYPIHLCLMAPAQTKNIRRVYSHFVPLHVTQPWLESHYPEAERIVVASTSTAADRAAREPDAAAVGNPAAAEVYGLKIIHRNLAHASQNVTRFLVVGKRTRTGRIPAMKGATGLRAMVHLRLKNRVGALADTLVALKDSGFNLTQILSRPVQGRLGEHQFLIEMEVPRSTGVQTVAALLDSSCTFLNVLGIYPHRSI